MKDQSNHSPKGEGRFGGFPDLQEATRLSEAAALLLWRDDINIPLLTALAIPCPLCSCLAHLYIILGAACEVQAGVS